ncbi:crystal protein-like [Branchiostoma floridae]|uniref:Crystal protein-like n=1 Tax=Branchiostoma floridae TaxID=7739 RepID=A0A9J7HQY8_BRAFL|nr:crystal protein-like [Branchiostoma floridae]
MTEEWKDHLNEIFLKEFLRAPFKEMFIEIINEMLMTTVEDDSVAEERENLLKKIFLKEYKLLRVFSKGMLNEIVNEMVISTDEERNNLLKRIFLKEFLKKLSKERFNEFVDKVLLSTDEDKEHTSPSEKATEEETTHTYMYNPVPGKHKKYRDDEKHSTTLQRMKRLGRRLCRKLGLKEVGGLAFPIEEDGPVVRTQYSDVRGLYVEDLEGVIFFGLPYGEPPVGEFRWKPPRQYNRSWAPKVRDGTVPGPGCYQSRCGPNDGDDVFQCPRDRKVSEDCLYLNIFAPRTILNSAAAKLPILFWIHGGENEQGSGSAYFYDGRFLSNKTNAIVVTTNYRLAAFGYLVAGQGEDAATGNYGLLDQAAGLRWVKENIGSFGGDKNRVTVFGQSTGSDATSTLLISPKFADLFHHAIMLSVPLTIPHKSRWEALRLGDHLADKLGCSHGDMKCLRSKNSSALQAGLDRMGTFFSNPYRPLEVSVKWGPVVDGDIVPGPTVDSFAKGHFQSKPFIIGTTSEEAVLYIYSLYNKPVTSLVTLYAIYAAFVHLKAVEVSIEYPTETNTSDYRPHMSKLTTDWVFKCSTRNVIRSAVRKGNTNVWLYVFDHVWSFPHLWDYQKNCNGHVCHAEDLPFVFQTTRLPVTNMTMTAEEQKMADAIAYYYGNFAHTGDPNQPSRDAAETTRMTMPGTATTWPKYNQEGNFPCLNISTPSTSLIHDYRKDKCDFWDRMDVYNL